jgi:hypothetical protein
MKVNKKYLGSNKTKKDQLVRGLGCGYSMNFDELPRLSNIDAILMDWYTASDIVELQARIDADQAIQEQKRKQEDIVEQNLIKI